MTLVKKGKLKKRGTGGRRRRGYVEVSSLKNDY